MKKVLVVLSVAMLLSQYSCSSNKTEETESLVDSAYQELKDSINSSIEDVKDAVENVSDTSDAVEEVDSKKFDKFLDDYEEYVDKLISLQKKSKNGDLSAIAEMGSLMSKATELQNDLSEAQASGVMTPKQIARLTKIISKLSTVNY